MTVVLSPTLAEFLLFQPSRGDPGPPPALLGVPGEVVTLSTADGIRIQSWWYQVARGEPGPAPAVLFLHGNAGDISSRTPIAEGLIGRGLSVLLLDYRGYGGSEGRPSEEGLLQDALAGWDFLLGKVGSPHRIVIFGRSMGGAVAARLAASRDSGGLILESSFTSLLAMGREVYPFLPSFLLSRLKGRFATREWVENVRTSLLVIHGSRDELVPLAMGREIFEAGKEPKEWLPVAGAGHNDVFWVGGSEYFRRIESFVRERGRGGPRD
jgi:fermentation-respiration switch protein FrsA (DUF1100 family)